MIIEYMRKIEPWSISFGTTLLISLKVLVKMIPDKKGFSWSEFQLRRIWWGSIIRGFQTSAVTFFGSWQASSKCRYEKFFQLYSRLSYVICNGYNNIKWFLGAVIYTYKRSEPGSDVSKSACTVLSALNGALLTILCSYKTADSDKTD